MGSAEWIRQIGDEKRDYYLFDISSDENGNLILAYRDDSAYYISRLDKQGTLNWTIESGKRLEGISASTGIYAMFYEDDGNLLLSRYSEDGVLVWSRILDDFIGSRENFLIESDKDGNVYVYGEDQGSTLLREYMNHKSGQMHQVYDTDVLIVKYDFSGDKLWTKRIGAEEFDKPINISVLDGGDVIVTGATKFSSSEIGVPGSSFSTFSSFATILDRNGNEQSTFEYQLLHVSGDIEYRSQYWSEVDKSGNIYSLYKTGMGNGDYRPLLLTKTSGKGAEIWTIPMSIHDLNITRMSINGDIIGVFSKGLGENFDLKLSLYNTDGDLLSEQRIGTPFNEGSPRIANADDNSFYIAGVTGGNLKGSANNNLGFYDIFAGKIQHLAGNISPANNPRIYGSFLNDHRINISISTIEDPNNYAGFIPDFNFSWQQSYDNGTTWKELLSNDATDNNNALTLTLEHVGSLVRGVVRYIDGDGHAEILYTDFSVVKLASVLKQEIFSSGNELIYTPTMDITVPLQYRTSTGDSQLSGLTLNVHYNSSILTPTATNNGVSDQIPAAITSSKIIQDTNDLDNDPLTDKIIQMVWATFDNTFPNKTLPTTLANVTFNTSSQTHDPVTGEPLTTTLRYTARETAAGYDFLTNATTLKATPFTLDVDGDGQVKALTDGLMIIRKLLGPAFDGDALTYKAIGSGATRTTAEIHDYIQSGIDSGLLDVDKNGKTTALTDGLMVIRRLLGPAFDGEALTFKALASDSSYFGKADAHMTVATAIDTLQPIVIVPTGTSNIDHPAHQGTSSDSLPIDPVFNHTGGMLGNLGQF